LGPAKDGRLWHARGHV